MLHGRIDRIDAGTDAQAVRLIDYKTTSRGGARRQSARSRWRTRSWPSTRRCSWPGKRAAGRSKPATWRSTTPMRSSTVVHPDVEDSARELARQDRCRARAHRGRRAVAGAGRGARCATPARRAVCAGATTGATPARMHPVRLEPAYRADGRDCDRSALLCAGLRPRAQRRGRGVRRCRQDVAAGVAHRACAARRRRARRDPGDHLHPQGGQRDARAAARVAARIRRGQPRASGASSCASAACRSRDAARLEPALAQLHARVLHAGAEVQIHTFHAWFAQLLRLAPLEMLDALGLHPAMSLIEEIDDQLGELLRRFQREVLNAPASMADYQALTERHGRWRLDQWLRAAIDKRLEIERADARGALEPAVEAASHRWPACAGFDHPLLRITGDARTEAAARPCGRRAGRGRQDRAQSGRRVGCGARPRRRAGGAGQGPRGLVHEARPAAQARRPAAAVNAAVAALLELEQQVTQQDAHDDHRRMVRLSRLLLGCWHALKRERALMDMQDLERGALALLADPATSGWVQQRLDARLRHVLIDEFQDTSNLQWQALQSWLASYAGAGGGASGRQPLSVFIVGDPKQSIYRFRGAEPRVFAAARRFVVEGLAGHDLACNHTRRNATGRDRRDQCRAGPRRGRRRLRRLCRRTARSAPANPAERFDTCSDAPPDDQPAASRASGWRDSLTMPRHDAREPRARDEARRVARGVQQLIREGRAEPGQVMVLARRHALAGAGGAGVAGPARPLRCRRGVAAGLVDRGQRPGGGARRAGVARPRPVARAGAEEPAVRCQRRASAGAGASGVGPRCDRMVERLAGLARCAGMRWRARATCWRVGRSMRAGCRRTTCSIGWSIRAS